ncbi:MAG TPA: hypothetical protein VNC84_03290 [Gammaproteobacteria bacterium]|jgi:hypothetical protein|nr:hypothetical protein [Gammaproteobacteria bacterium]
MKKNKITKLAERRQKISMSSCNIKKMEPPNTAIIAIVDINNDDTLAGEVGKPGIMV